MSGSLGAMERGTHLSCTFAFVPDRNIAMTRKMMAEKEVRILALMRLAE